MVISDPSTWIEGAESRWRMGRVAPTARLAGYVDAYRRFEELTGAEPFDAEPFDAEVDRLAHEVVGLGPTILALLPEVVSSSRDATTSPDSAEVVLRALRADMSPAQQRCFELILAVLISDAGPTRRAARVPVVGASRVQQHISGVWRLSGLSALLGPDQLPPARVLDVNSSPSLVVDTPGGPVVITGEATAGRITSLWVRLNPDKTAALDHQPPLV
jgi:hypothetical protein